MTYTEYRGYMIIKGWDWKYRVYDGKKFIISLPTLRSAKESVCKITRFTNG